MNPVWLLLIGVGGLLVLLGAWLLFVRPRLVLRAGVVHLAKGPCRDLLVAWKTIERECADARAAAADAPAWARTNEICSRVPAAEAAYRACVKADLEAATEAGTAGDKRSR